MMVFPCRWHPVVNLVPGDNFPPPLEPSHIGGGERTQQRHPNFHIHNHPNGIGGIGTGAVNNNDDILGKQQHDNDNEKFGE